MRKFGFWLILISLPLLLIAALEGAVRLLGLVPTYPVFVPHPAAPQYLTMRQMSFAAIFQLVQKFPMSQ